ncbi:unnamed protein product [Closterium sp. NIES-54]
MACPNSPLWLAAIIKELEAFIANSSFVDLPRPPASTNVVKGKWVFRVKQLPGEPPVYKARYCAKGFTQRYAVDFFDTFSPTAKPATVRAVLDLAARLNMEIHSMDVSNTFLQGVLRKLIYMERPAGFHLPFPANSVCLFLRASPSPFYILVNVDDMILLTADLAELERVKAELGSRLKCKDLGELQHCLGMTIPAIAPPAPSLSPRVITCSRSWSVGAIAGIAVAGVSVLALLLLVPLLFLRWRKAPTPFSQIDNDAAAAAAASASAAAAAAGAGASVRVSPGDHRGRQQRQGPWGGWRSVSSTAWTCWQGQQRQRACGQRPTRLFKSAQRAPQNSSAHSSRTTTTLSQHPSPPPLSTGSASGSKGPSGPAQAAGPVVCRQYRLDVLAAATGMWAEANKIGSGGFGDVYRAEDPADPSTLWAVKRAKVLTNDFRRESLCHWYCTGTSHYRSVSTLPSPAPAPTPAPAPAPPSSWPSALRGHMQVNEMASKHHPHLVRLLGKFLLFLNVPMCFLLALTTVLFHPLIISRPLTLSCRASHTSCTSRALRPHSFGVVMLTILTARKAIYNSEDNQINLKQWVAPFIAANDGVTFKDPSLEAPPDIMLRLARLALSCTAMPTALRPNMIKVLAELEALREEVRGATGDQMARRIDREIDDNQGHDLEEEVANAIRIGSSGGGVSGGTE